MIAFRLRPLPFLALAFLATAPSQAQEVVQALPGTTDADALASDMRRIAGNPRDIDSLLDAARLSLRLGDVRAAGALLQRAENVNPRDPRVRAGQAGVLLQSERPGQALRYFAEAEAQGLDAGQFAADRGLAYDLTGQQDRAQRDYARALRTAPGDDETIRRYALSLGISGQRQRALALLDPLVRRSDRAAWRAQAFVLAMTGDIGGAQRIAATMMPGGASGLSAFFERLPTLPATDRAFAVHFGEVRPTPERLADARLAPPVGALPREPVVLAAVQPIPQPAQTRVRRGRERAETPTVLAALPTRGVQFQAPGRQPLPAQTVAPTTIASVVAAASTVPQPAASILAAAREPAAATVVAVDSPMTVAPTPATTLATPPARVAETPTAVAATGAVAVAQPAAAPVRQVALPPSSPVMAAMTPRAVVRSSVSRASGDAILARIIQNLSIPGSELGVSEPTRAVAAAEPATPGETPISVRAEQADRERIAAERAASDRAATARALADKRAADRKAATDRKALAERKAAAEKKALADKEAAEKKRIERANPGRIWVQVAGGAYEGDLPKAYAAVKAKAPSVFGSRAGYTTPLRATNRVLTGPFKTDAEARAFVNDLKKEGVAAFTFESDSGQPVARLGAKGKADDAASAKDDAKPSTRSRRRR